jgi:hypothetical protein
VRPKIRCATSDLDDDHDTLDHDMKEQKKKEEKESTHHRWKSIWRQPNQGPPKKWVKETAKNQRTTMQDYAKIIDLLRGL